MTQLPSSLFHPLIESWFAEKFPEPTEIQQMSLATDRSGRESVDYRPNRQWQNAHRFSLGD